MQVISFYDVDGSGLICYRELINDVCKLDRSWMSYNEGLLLPINDFSARVVCPNIVKKVRHTSPWNASKCVRPNTTEPVLALRRPVQLQDKLKRAAEDWAAKFRKIQPATARDAFHGICLRYDKASTGRVAMADFSKVGINQDVHARMGLGRTSGLMILCVCVLILVRYDWADGSLWVCVLVRMRHRYWWS